MARQTDDDDDKIDLRESKSSYNGVLDNIMHVSNCVIRCLLQTGDSHMVRAL